MGEIFVTLETLRIKQLQCKSKCKIYPENHTTLLRRHFLIAVRHNGVTHVCIQYLIFS